MQVVRQQASRRCRSLSVTRKEPACSNKGSIPDAACKIGYWNTFPNPIGMRNLSATHVNANVMNNAIPNQIRFQALA